MSGRAEPRTPGMSSRAALDTCRNKAQEAEQLPWPVTEPPKVKVWARVGIGIGGLAER
jgi:hypothetical protein